MDVKAGDEHSVRHSPSGLLHLLDGLAPEQRPRIVRSDCAFGPDTMIHALKKRGPPYLFLISDESQRAHLVSLRGGKLGVPAHEVRHGNESSAISTRTVDA